MNVAELIIELQKHPPDAKVIVEWQQYPPCTCAEYCYCTPYEKQEPLETIDYWTGNTPPFVLLRAYS